MKNDCSKLVWCWDYMSLLALLTLVDDIVRLRRRKELLDGPCPF